MNAVTLESTGRPATIAVTADIHGNLWALEAVLDDARLRGAELLIDLGDLVYGPLDPGGTIAAIRSAGLPLVRVLGNEDRVIWENDGADPNHPSVGHTRACLTEEQIEWLRRSPMQASVCGIHFFHGRPGRDDRYLLHAVERGGLRAATAAEVRTALGELDAPVILCGHSHLAGVAVLDDGTMVVNPGSVGLQAFADSRPWPHVVENRDPLARYARLVWAGGRWVPALHAVPYDWEAASRHARRNGRPDWARALESGLA